MAPLEEEREVQSLGSSPEGLTEKERISEQEISSTQFHEQKEEDAIRMGYFEMWKLHLTVYLPSNSL